MEQRGARMSPPAVVCLSVNAMFSIRVAIMLIAVLPLQVCADKRDPDITVTEFVSDVCAPCQRMKPVVETLKREGYPITTLDYDRQRIEADWHGVSQVPAYVVFRGDRAERILQGVVPEQELRQVFSACDPAKAGSATILPGPSDEKEEWMPAPELPPTPQPVPRPDHGPYHRDRTSPPPKTEVPQPVRQAGSRADILIYSYGPSQPPQPDPAPNESATPSATTNPSNRSDQAGRQATASDFAQALAEARSRILGSSGAGDGVPPGTATTDPAIATESTLVQEVLGERGDSGNSTSSSSAQPAESPTAPALDWLGVGRSEAIYWLISVGLGAAGFTWGGPLGAALAKSAGRAVLRLLVRKRVESKPEPSLNDDYAAQLNELYALSGRSPTADATLGREFDRVLTEDSKGNDQVALYARNKLREVYDKFRRIHDNTPTPAEPIPDGQPQGR
jgi:thioredoxin family protein